MSSRFANLRTRALDADRATKTGTPVQIDGDPPFVVFVRQHRGANRRSLYVAGQLFAEAGIADLEGVARAEALRALEVELVATELVVRWEGLVDDQGDEIACTPETVRELIGEIPDVLDQILEAAQDEARFRHAAGIKSGP